MRICLDEVAALFACECISCLNENMNNNRNTDKVYGFKKSMGLALAAALLLCGCASTQIPKLDTALEYSIESFNTGGVATLSGDDVKHLNGLLRLSQKVLSDRKEGQMNTGSEQLFLLNYPDENSKGLTLIKDSKNGGQAYYYIFFEGEKYANVYPVSVENAQKAIDFISGL